MKKNKEYITRVVILFLLWFCITACSRMDTIEDTNDGFRFLISPPSSFELDTKASLSSITVNNVWIIQFNKETKNILNSLYVNKEKISQSPGSTILVTLNTGDATFSNVASLFYIIVNGGESLFTLDEIGTGSEGTLTESGLKSKTVDFTFPSNGSSIQTTEPSLLTAGPIEYTPTDNKIVVVSRMFRAFSRQSVTVNYTGSSGVFTPSKIYVNNIPNKMALFEAGGSDDIYYPSTETSENLIETSDKTYSFGWGNNTTNAMTFYMPENLRGAGTATTQQEKGLETKGPNGSLKGCTSLTVEGTYKYDSGHTGEVGVKYTFYLGGNFTDDYNIYRDYQYNMTINIKGINSADLRVSITNGNVVVFDDVKEFNNEVTF